VATRSCSCSHDYGVPRSGSVTAVRAGRADPWRPRSSPPLEPSLGALDPSQPLESSAQAWNPSRPVEPPGRVIWHTPNPVVSRWAGERDARPSFAAHVSRSMGTQGADPRAAGWCGGGSRLAGNPAGYRSNSPAGREPRPDDRATAGRSRQGRTIAPRPEDRATAGRSRHGRMIAPRHRRGQAAGTT
jgi:hypothetical protein